jgi:LysR family positive regulator for ilvC
MIYSKPNVSLYGTIFMDITKLRLFCNLANSLHFGRAAARSNVSPSTLSRNIKQLEDDLGVSLFIRDNRSVNLTHEGEQFLGFAQQVIQQWETYQESLQAQAEELRGQLSIYCSVTASYSFLYEILTEFRVSYPGIAIKLHTGDPAQALQRVLAGDEDIAIAVKPERLPSGISFKPISRSPLIFITARNQVDWQSKHWEDVPLIIPEEGLARERLDRWFVEEGFQPNVYAEVRGNEAIVSMVSLGFGVGVVPKIVVDNSPLAERVRQFKQQPHLGPYDTGLCVLEKRLRSPIINAFWSQLQEPRLPST